MMAGDPGQGGATWAVLQYVLGLRRLGHEVLFLEPIAPKSLRPAGARLADSENAAYFRAVLDRFDLNGSAALILPESGETFGRSYEPLRAFAHSADLLVNISGLLPLGDLAGRIPARVYLDLDPAFNQLWSAVQKIDMRFEGHTHFFTVGLTVGEPGCSVPDCGRKWLKTLQPVVLERWPVAGKIAHDGLTTVANWRGYGSIEHHAIFYGQKAHSLRPLLRLPQQTTEAFILALAIHPAETKDLQALSAHGWRLLDPGQVAGSPDAYHQFVQGSKAEFGLAKSGYVVSGCGWFSDRSACYLASGRPVIAQETGFSQWLPTGHGLFAFRGAEGVLEAIDRLATDYRRESAAARAIAEELFDSDKVLSLLLDKAGF
jgi:hypothetical protein